MRKLMGYNPREFLVVQPVDDARGQGYGVALLVDAAGKSIKLRVVHNVDFRHGHATGDAKVFHNVVDTWILPSRQRSGPRGPLNHRDIGEVGYDKPNGHPANHPGDSLQEIIVHGRGIYLIDRVAIFIIMTTPEIIEQSQEQPYHA